MPRFVRPSFVNVSVANGDVATSNRCSTGPRSRDGELSALFSVRSAGVVLPLLDVHAIGSVDGKTVLYRVVDQRTGTVVFEERFAQ